MNAPPSKLILASRSPRRAELLRRAGIRFALPGPAPGPGGGKGETADPIEKEPLPDELPEAYARRLAESKAEAAAERLRGEETDLCAAVLAADTVVAIEGEILGKPLDRADARRMLEKLSGKEHLVHTAYCILTIPRERRIVGTIHTRVRFRTIGRHEIARYIATEEPYDKAGAYAIQGAAGTFVEEIHGSYTNVIGLPLEEVLGALREIGITPDREK